MRMHVHTPCAHLRAPHTEKSLVKNCGAVIFRNDLQFHLRCTLRDADPLTLSNKSVRGSHTIHTLVSGLQLEEYGYRCIFFGCANLSRHHFSNRQQQVQGVAQEEEPMGQRESGVADHGVSHPHPTAQPCAHLHCGCSGPGGGQQHTVGAGSHSQTLCAVWVQFTGLHGFFRRECILD